MDSGKARSRFGVGMDALAVCPEYVGTTRTAEGEMMNNKPEIGRLCEVHAYDHIVGAETIETVEIDTVGWRIALKDWRILAPMPDGYIPMMVGEGDIMAWRYWEPSEVIE